MGQTAHKLHAVVRIGDREACERLLAARADPDEATLDGTTPLMFAVNAGHVECSRQLLAARANPDARSRRGETALHLSIGAGSGPAECVRLLADAGADLSVRNAQGGTALHDAGARDYVGIVHILLDGGAAMDDADAHGLTAEATAGKVCRELLREARKLSLSLTVHVMLPEEDGFVDVSCTGMGGEELCVVRAALDGPVKDLRATIGKQMRSTGSVGLFSLMFPDGSFMHAGQDHRRLREIMVSCSSY